MHYTYKIAIAILISIFQPVYFSLFMKKAVFRVSQSDHRLGCIITEDGYGLAGCIYEIKVLYYLCSKNNSEDQPCS